jgi:hypothetical protein
MGQDAYRKISEIRNCVTGITIKLFLHTQVWWWHSQVPRPATRSELTRTSYVACWPQKRPSVRFDGYPLLKAADIVLEGFVYKRRDQPYQAGRSKHWIKVKNRNPATERIMESFT